VRTPEFPVVPVVASWGAGGDALGECSGCAEVVGYEPESLTPGRPLLCRPCGLAALGLAGF
jgi:hypothetical protein